MASKLIQVTQSSAFARGYKKLHTKQKHDVDTAVDIIVTNPLAGEPKRGDLAGGEVPEFVGPIQPTATSAVGLDLGLKTCATASDGQKIIGRFYRGLEAKLGIAQRARKKSRARAIHAKIANQRKDMLHKFSSNLVKNRTPLAWNYPCF
jgi:hypothetical protein